MEQEAKEFLKSIGNDNFEVEKQEKKVVLKKKDSKLSQLLLNYKEHFYLIFSNGSAMILIVACFLRLWMACTLTLYINEYMKTYESNY